MHTVDETEERQLLGAVKRAAALVDGGMTPDEAVEKVAREEGFGPGKIGLVAHAYNTGRQTHQWEAGGSVLDKLAAFPLADAGRVIAGVYGDRPKEAAADADYRRPPDWADRPAREKAARAPLPVTAPPPPPYQADPAAALRKASAAAGRAKLAADEAGRLASAKEDEVRGHVAHLVGYFKQASHSRLPFASAEAAARVYLGPTTAALFDLLYKQARLREKRAGAVPPRLDAGIDLRADPFRTVAACVAAADECGRLRGMAKEARDEAARVKEAAFRPFWPAGGKAPPPGGSDGTVLLKAGLLGWGSEVGAIATGDYLAESQLAKNRHPEEEPNLFDDDPGRGREVAGIGQRAALDAMLTDPKNPLSKHTPTDVTAAYNDVVKLAPHLADQPEALQPLLEARLKHRLGGQVERAIGLDRAVAGREKEGFLSTVGPAVGTMFGRTMGSVPKLKDELVEDEWMKLEDPQHHNELRKIKAHAMLSQLMSDPDDPISGHDPDRVLRAYNEIASMSPRLADQPAALAPVLRRRLEGAAEPFEAKELAETEKSLAASRTPTPHTNLLSQTPLALQG